MVEYRTVRFSRKLLDKKPIYCITLLIKTVVLSAELLLPRDLLSRAISLLLLSTDDKAKLVVCSPVDGVLTSVYTEPICSVVCIPSYDANWATKFVDRDVINVIDHVPSSRAVVGAHHMVWRQRDVTSLLAILSRRDSGIISGGARHVTDELRSVESSGFNLKKRSLKNLEITVYGDLRLLRCLSINTAGPEFHGTSHWLQD